jgi:hypothetical protein
MNKNSDPIEFLIEFAWANGADRFVVNNAKDELKKLREYSEDSKRWLSCEKELAKLKEIIKRPVAYGSINDKNDLYNLKLGNNIYSDQTKIVPLYSTREEFLKEDWKGYNTYGKFSK